MKKKAHNQTKEGEEKKLKKMLKTKKRNNTNCACGNHRSLDNPSNSKYKYSNG